MTLLKLVLHADYVHSEIVNVDTLQHCKGVPKRISKTQGPCRLPTQEYRTALIRLAMNATCCAVQAYAEHHLKE